METTNTVTKRDKPSTKARSKSYFAMRKLFDVISRFGISHPYKDIDEDSYQNNVDYKGWKDWANKHTPWNRRGGPDVSAKRRKQKEKDRKSTIR